MENEALKTAIREAQWKVEYYEKSLMEAQVVLKALIDAQVAAQRALNMNVNF